MSDLLKEAIADARAVRETALQNAKMALQEAFTPQLKSMLSAKLREDEDEYAEDEDEFGGEDESGDVAGDEFGGEDEFGDDADEFGEADEFGGEDEFGGDDEFSDEEPETEGIIEIDGVKYAPVVSEDEDEFGGEDDFGGEDEFSDEEDDSLELEAIIRELEDDEDDLTEEDDAYDTNVPPKNSHSLAEEDDAYDEDVEGKKDSNHVKGVNENIIFEIDESLFEEDDDFDDDFEDDIEEQTTSSGIGSGTGVTSASASDEEDPVKEKLYSELKEYKQAVRFLKDKLHEVNILNAKLLFTNKIFKEFALSNNQKMKVVENFDRAHTTREIKIVYSTLCEGFIHGKGIRRKSINENASSIAGSTRPSRKIITEEQQVANRFKTLANIK